MPLTGLHPFRVYFSNPFYKFIYYINLWRETIFLTLSKGRQSVLKQLLWTEFNLQPIVRPAFEADL